MDEAAIRFALDLHVVAVVAFGLYVDGDSDGPGIAVLVLPALLHLAHDFLGNQRVAVEDQEVAAHRLAGDPARAEIVRHLVERIEAHGDIYTRIGDRV